MKMKANLVAGLDIGSTKTCAVIAEVMPDARGAAIVKIRGVGATRTGGIRREVVTDIEGTTASVRHAMKEAELQSGVAVDRVYIGVAGDHIHARSSSGVVAVQGEEIDVPDVKRVHDVARAVVVPSDREVLHVIPQGYTVDHRNGIHDPIGMAGTRLEADVYIITSSVTATQHLHKAVGRAGYRIEAMIHEPLATARGVLAHDEKDVGVALIDLGGGSTELSIFRDGKLRHIASIPFGGSTITSDLARGLAITFAEAEKAKEKHGVAFARMVDPRETVELPGPGPGTKRDVARELIAHVIEQRLDEILSLVAREIESAGEAGRLGAGVVLTGGGAGLTGVAEVARYVFSMPVRIGTAGDGLSGLYDSVTSPQYATATGLARLAAERVAVASGIRIGSGFTGRVMAWIREFF
jgi:cell division protein FtsA